MSYSEQDGRVGESAFELLIILGELERWVKADDPRAKPFLDAGALKLLDDGRVAFHRDRLIPLLAAHYTPYQVKP